MADAKFLLDTDVDDTPVDAATTDPISSNWAYDHENAADPHPEYTTEVEAIVWAIVFGG